MHRVVQELAANDEDIELLRQKLVNLTTGANTVAKEISKLSVTELTRLSISVGSGNNTGNKCALIAKAIFANSFEKIDQKRQRLQECRDAAENVVAHCVSKEFAGPRGISTTMLSEFIVETVETLSSGGASSATPIVPAFGTSAPVQAMDTA
jgi:hypothetical protein